MKKKTFAFSLLLGLWLVLAVFAPASYAAVIVVNSTADDVIASNGNCTLREAITNANLPAGGDVSGGDCIAGGVGADTITFDSSLDGTPITLSIAGRLENSNATGDLDITDNLTINGNGARVTIIDGNDIDRVVDIHPGITMVINGVTIRNGDANQTVADGTPGTGGEDGGGVRASGGNTSLTINDSRITSNHAYDDGGGVSTNTSTTTININRSLIDNNSAAGSATDNGGGLNAWPAGNITTNNTTISNNSSGSGGNGGAAFTQGGTITLNNTTVTGNTDIVGGNAGLAAASGGTFVLMNTIVSGNSPTDCTTFGGFGTITSNGYNVVGSGGSANGCPSGGTGDQILAGAIGTLLNTTLASNGGATDTHALVGGGQAVDPSPDTTACGTTLTVDQRGGVRADGVNRGGSTCDVGAYEFDSTQTPTAVTLQQASTSQPNPWLWLVSGLVLLLGGTAVGLLRRRTA